MAFGSRETGVCPTPASGRQVWMVREVCTLILLSVGSSQVSWSLQPQIYLYEPDLKEMEADQENYFQLSTCHHSLTIVPEDKGTFTVDLDRQLY